MVKMEASMSDEKIAVTKQAKAIHSIVAIEKLALNMGAWQRNLKNRRSTWESLKVSRRLV